jgi:hypothetical protein
LKRTTKNFSQFFWTNQGFIVQMIEMIRKVPAMIEDLRLHVRISKTPHSHMSREVTKSRNYQPQLSGGGGTSNINNINSQSENLVGVRSQSCLAVMKQNCWKEELLEGRTARRKNLQHQLCVGDRSQSCLAVRTECSSAGKPTDVGSCRSQVWSQDRVINTCVPQEAFIPW